MVVRLTASEKGKITFTANMTSPHENVLISSEGSEAVLHGVSSKHEGLKGKVRFQGRMTVQTVGGKTAYSDGVISVTGADEATLYLTIGTNVRSYKDITGDEVAQSKARLHEAMALGYEALKAMHTKTYKHYYDRVTLDKEYQRDIGKGIPIQLPKNYYPDDDPDNKPRLLWRAHANTLYANWINYYVYQLTPYSIGTRVYTYEHLH